MFNMRRKREKEAEGYMPSAFGCMFIQVALLVPQKAIRLSAVH